MTMIVAHRGASKRAHENTLEAFEHAVAIGADMVELDVRKTADGVLVVFHDPVMKSPTGDAPIGDLTYEDVLRRAAQKKFRVPALEDVFKALAGKIALDIELKEAGYASHVVALARRYCDLSSCVFTSFDPRIIGEVKADDASLRTGLILANAAALTWCENADPAVLAPGKRLFSAHRDYFEKAHRAGKYIAVWTVDGTALLGRLLVDPVVDAIITNYPDRALALRTKLRGI